MFTVECMLVHCMLVSNKFCTYCIKKCDCQSSVFVHFLDMIILQDLQCISLGTQVKSSGEQLKIRDLFLDDDKLQLHLAVSS